MKKIIFNLMLAVMILAIPIQAFTLNAYFDDQTTHKEIEFGDNLTYFVDVILNSWGTQGELSVRLFDQTFDFKQIGELEQITFSAPFYFSPELIVSKQDYVFRGNYLMDISATQQNIDGTQTIRSKILTFNVLGDRQIVANFSFSPTTPLVSEPVLFQSNSIADGQIVEFKWDINGQIIGNEESLVYSFSSPGTFNVALTIQDEFGQTNSVSKQITVVEPQVPPQGPVANFIFNPLNPFVGDQVTFTSTSVQGNSPIVNYNWFVDGELVSSQPQFVKSFNEAKVYQIKLLVEDQNNLVSELTKQITVSEIIIEPEGPTADFMFVPTNPVAQELITFTSTSVVGDAPIKNFVWTLNNHVIGFGPFLTRSFEEPGNYDVRLRVVDENNLDSSISKQINVLPAPQPLLGPAANFTFNPKNHVVGQTVTFTSTSIEGDAPINNFVWRIGKPIIGNQSVINYTFSQPGEYSVRLTVTDENELSNSTFKIVTVHPLPVEDPQLIISELGCNSNVVQGQNQHCSARVQSNIENVVQGVFVTFKYKDSDEVLGVCSTNKAGACYISPIIQKELGSHTVYAIAQKQGYEPDNSMLLTTTFRVWAQRYEILGLTLYEDAYLTESYEFFRGSPIYSSFSVLDKFTSQLLPPSTDLVSEVFIRVNNANELYFEKDTFTSNQFRFFLPSIPLTNDYLGEGQVFSFVFNFTDGTAGQDSVTVNILNNEIEFDLPSSFEFETNQVKNIDFKEFVQDLETPSSDISISFENTGDFVIESLGQNIFKFTAPTYAIHQFIYVTANDNDGSVKTSQTILKVNKTQDPVLPVGPMADFIFSPEDPVVGDLVSFTSISVAGDSPISNFSWSVDGVFVSFEESFVYKFDGPGTFEVMLVVFDELKIGDIIAKNITVSDMVYENELTIVELNCGKNVLINSSQMCSGLVVDNTQINTQNVNLEFFYKDSNHSLGSCQTNKEGVCFINFQAPELEGQYSVYAIAKKEGYISDDSKRLHVDFNVFKLRYVIENLKLHNDSFAEETRIFLRGDTLKASFDIVDLFTNQKLMPNHLTGVRVNLYTSSNQKINLDEIPLTILPGTGNFKYALDFVPANAALGDALVSVDVNSFDSFDASQKSVKLTILNSPLSFIPPLSFTFEREEAKIVDFKLYLNDFETSLDKINLSFENQGDFIINDLNNNVFQIIAPNKNVVQSLVVTAQDGDGSSIRKIINLIVFESNIIGPRADFTILPESKPIIQFNPVTLIQNSTRGDNPIVQYIWSVNGENIGGKDSVIYTFTKIGINNVTLKVVDSKGLSDEITKSFEVISTMGPKADFVFSPNNPSENMAILFSQNSSSGSFEIINFEWFIENQTLQGPQVTYKFDKPGFYDVSLRVTDTFGLQDKITKRIPVGVTQSELRAVLTVPRIALEGQTIILDGSNSLTQELISLYKFEVFRFGELIFEETTTQSSVEFEVSNRGRYEVVLTIVDSAGNSDSHTKQMDVARDMSRTVEGDFEGLHVSNIEILGSDVLVLSFDEYFSVYATVTNNKNVRLENLRLTFSVPEIGYNVKGSAFTLRPGESLQRSIHGLLPAEFEDFPYSDLIVTVGVSGSGFNRNIYVPVDISN